MVGFYSACKDLFTKDCVCIAENFKFVLGDFADSSDCKTGAWEGLTVDERVGQTEFFADDAHFVFEKTAQGFDKTDKRHIFWQAADVVVALDVCRVVCTRFDDVGVDRALRKEVIAFVRGCNVRKRFDKLCADDFAFLFRFDHAFEF